ncbi:MAG: site-specific integrase [Lachnospiraceae bacterium]|nr:site-specific integrase [Lachnospiraceae bacterium]
MSAKRTKTNYTGVYAREHASRRYRGKPDICYDICYRLPGERQLIWEKVGWLSEKVSASMASYVRAERLKHARKVDNLPADNARLTLDEVFERFRSDYLEVMRKRPMDAVSIYENRIKPTLGHLPLIDITNVEVENLRKGESHLSPQSTRHTLNLLGQIFRQAARWGLYEGPIPTDNVKVQQCDGRRMRFLTRAEAKTLLDELHERSLSLWQMSLLSLYTGLRAGEVFHLRWEHVNFTAGTITVMDSKNAMNRVVHMPEQVREMLEEHRSETKGQAGRLVFPKAGTQNTPHHQISPGFRLILRDTKLNEGITDPRDKVVFHTLRHTYASWLVQAGVPLYTVQRLMGHKSIIMTQRYAHLAPDQGAEAARLLSGIKLNGESSSC